MEPIQRRSFNSVPQRRPMMGDINGPMAARPVQPARQASTAPQTGSILQQPSHHPRPAAPQASPQPSVLHPVGTPSAHPQQHTGTHHPAPAQGFSPHHSPTMAQPAQPRPTYAPAHLAAQHPVTAQPAASPFTPSQPHAIPTAVPAAQPAQQPIPAEAPHLTHDPVRLESDISKPHKGPHPTGHAGLVGLAVFVLFGALFFTPFLPGKIWDDAPLSSQSFSTGDQNIDCLGTLGKASTVLNYDSKMGFPLTYNYATTSTLSASCDGKQQTATGGHTSQFNPLGLLADFAIVLALAIIASKVWRRFHRSE